MTSTPAQTGRLRVGTRSSPMALAQVDRLRAELLVARPEVSVEVVPLSTSGDRWQGSLAVLGGKGAFTKELDQELIAGSLDVVVHCLKDVPGDQPLPAGTRFSSFLERDDVRDALISPAGLTLADLPAGSVVGTSSVRRVAQLKRRYPQLTTVPIRGNANSRLDKVDRGDCDALILAYAGLARIGLEHRATEIFSPADMAPPIGAGVLVLQCREDDESTLAMLAPLNCPTTEVQAQAERSLLAALGGHCNSPIAGHARMLDNDGLELTGQVYSNDGTTALEARLTGTLDKAEVLGREVAEALLAQGARELIDATAPVA